MKKLITLTLSILLVTPIFADDETVLSSHMSELSGLLKSIRKVETSAEKAEIAAKAQDELLKCFPLIPALTEKTTDPAKKALEIADYKKLLTKNLALLCDYEIAFLNGDEGAAEEIGLLLKKMKKEGHSQYIEQE